ncbi:hypothetical protein GW17_00058052 [Ensete ventricosum]|nr:hypothetical protein GW17_00058052 [Ensete ventricosum]
MLGYMSRDPLSRGLPRNPVQRPRQDRGTRCGPSDEQVSASTEKVYSSRYVANQPEASSSSGALTPTNMGTLKALEVMKLCHDCDSILSVELLATVWGHYSIPDEYDLHAPVRGQLPYNPFPDSAF